MNQKRAIILIDGSNFYFKLKDLKLHHLLNFKFSKFINSLAKGYKVTKAVYFIGAIKTDGSLRVKKMHNDQQRLFSHLKKEGLSYSLGYLLKSDRKFHEKGVDVNIAVDILVAAYEDLSEQIIIISSDTDLLPAVKKAKQKGKGVEYIGFSHKPSVAMVANCSTSRLLTKDELTQFIQDPKKETK